jgi:hypothetical protein
MKNKILFLLLFSFVLNSFAAIKSVKANINISNPVIESSLPGFINLLKSPYKLLDSISKNDVPLYPEYKQPLSKENTSNGMQDESYSLQDFNKLFKPTCKSFSIEYNGISSLSKGITENSHAPPPKQVEDYGLILFILLILYFVLLRRSNLPWEIKIAIFNGPITCIM